MRVLVTGSNGYIGSVMMGLLREAGHDVTGLDSCFFEGCALGAHEENGALVRKDVRDVEAADLEGFEAVLHLAALSNDPMGNLVPDVTYEINHRASVSLARAAREAGVSRYVFSSSCSMYGAASPEDVLDESANFNPVTAYAESKVFSERDISELATDDFHPTFLRNATAYGVSPQLRADLVVNNLVGWAFTTGEVMIKSDGTPWRPLVHVEDICRAFAAVLEAPIERIHNEAFNVGRNGENYQIRTIADFVRETVKGSKIQFAEGAGPDTRCYRVDFSKIERQLPEFKPQWTVPLGVTQLYEAYQRHGLTMEQLEGHRFMRINHLRDHLDAGRLDPTFRWVQSAVGVSGQG